MFLFRKWAIIRTAICVWFVMAAFSHATPPTLLSSYKKFVATEEGAFLLSDIFCGVGVAIVNGNPGSLADAYECEAKLRKLSSFWVTLCFCGHRTAEFCSVFSRFHENELNDYRRRQPRHITRMFRHVDCF